MCVIAVCVCTRAWGTRKTPVVHLNLERTACTDQCGRAAVSDQWDHSQGRWLPNGGSKRIFYEFQALGYDCNRCKELNKLFEEVEKVVKEDGGPDAIAAIPNIDKPYCWVRLSTLGSWGYDFQQKIEEVQQYEGNLAPRAFPECLGPDFPLDKMNPGQLISQFLNRCRNMTKRNYVPWRT